MTFPTDLDRLPFRLDLERLLREATEGPWNFFYKHKYNEFHVSVPMEGSGMKLALFEHGIPTKNGSDAELIVLLRNHAPAILELVRAAEAVASPTLANYSPATMTELRDALAKLNGGKE